MVRLMAPSPFDAAQLPELGDGLPAATRFLNVPNPIAGEHGSVIAFVPCQGFEQPGLYMLQFSGKFQIHRCLAHANGQDIEIVSRSDTVIARGRFQEIVEGRVIGIAFLREVSGPLGTTS